MLRLLSRPSPVCGRVAAASAVAATRSCSHRLLHSSVRLSNTINEHSMARMAGPTRTAMHITKRMNDRAHEEQMAATLPRTFDSQEEFLAQIDQTYSRLERGLSDMVEANAGMRVVRDAQHGLEIELGSERGSFMMHVETDKQRLVLFTPVTAATYKYHWDALNGQWVADCDGHAMEELFVRDIIYTGLQSFPQL